MSKFRRSLIGCLILSLALARHLFGLVISLLWLLLVVLVIASLSRNLGFFTTLKFDSYLSKIEVGDGLTALGILFASYGVMSAWRRQKREELMIESVEEIDNFFRNVVRIANSMSAEVRVLNRFVGAVKAEPEGGKWKYSTGYIIDIIPKIEAARISINESAILVHDLDAREALVVWSIPLAKKRFDRAVRAVGELSEISFLNLPLGASSEIDLRDWVLRVGNERDIEDEYERFSSKANLIASKIAGDVGGIRATIFGKYFPPTISGAKSIFEIEDDDG